MGQAAGNIDDVKPAGDIVREMIAGCVEQVKVMQSRISRL